MTNNPNDPQALREGLESAILSAASSTNSVIAWDALRHLLARAPPALTDKEFVALMIDGVNGKKLSAARWNQLVGLPGQATVVRGSRTLDPSDVPVKLPEDTRATLEKAFMTIIVGSERERATLEEQVASLVSASVLLAPSWSKQGRRDRIIATGIRGALAYGLRLLSDRRGSFAGALCRCGYSECRKFFLKRRARGGRGAPARKYCNPVHGRLGDDEKAVKRMELKRSRR